MAKDQNRRRSWKFARLSLFLSIGGKAPDFIKINQANAGPTLTRPTWLGPLRLLPETVSESWPKRASATPMSAPQIQICDARAASIQNATTLSGQAIACAS